LEKEDGNLMAEKFGLFIQKNNENSKRIKNNIL
jgi:hypothetical protein